MNASARIQPARKGFTLVELLMVIMIIGILLSMLMAAVYGVRVYMKTYVIKNDIQQMSLALNAYKSQYDEYPPDFWGVNSSNPTIRIPARQAVIRHLRKAFPKYPISGAGSVDQQFADFAARVQAACGLNPRNFDPPAAIAFWLGGIPERLPTLPTGTNPPVVVDSWTPAGFHSDPENPFRPGLPRIQPLFKFEPDRFDDVRLHAEDTGINQQLRYYPSGVVGGENAPYVYFRAERLRNGRYEYGAMADVSGDGNPDSVLPKSFQVSPSNQAVPYVEYRQPPAGLPEAITLTEGERMLPTLTPQQEYVRTWRSPDTFQVIAPGLDGLFGNGGQDSSGAPTLFRYTKSIDGLSPDGGDYDNVASFTKGASLEDEIE